MINKKTRFFINIALINIIVPIIIGFTRQLFVVIYNDTLNVSFIDSLIITLKSPVHILTIIFSLILIYFLFTLIKPIIEFDETKYDIKIIKNIDSYFPLIVFFSHIILWTIGTIIFYRVIKSEQHYKDIVYKIIPFHWSLLFSLELSLKTSLLSIFLIYKELFYWKTRLNLSNYDMKKKDILFINRNYLILFSVVLSFCCYSAFIIRYFILKKYTGIDINRAYISLIITLGINFLIYFCILLLSKKEDETQIDLINNIISDLSSGNADLSKKLSFIHFDRIGELIINFNKIIEFYIRYINIIKTLNKDIEETIINLNSTSKEIATISQEQSSSLQEILSTMKDSEQVINTINATLNNTIELSNKLIEDINKGYELINSQLSTVEKLKYNNNNNRKTVEELLNKLNNIQSITEIINSIAEQTKIIAFNTEFESLVNSKENNTFEIIASEIRKLANNIKDSTEEINKKIQNILNFSSLLIESSNNDILRIENGYSETLKTKDLFNDIIKHSEDSKNKLIDILKALNYKLSSYSDIFMNLKKLTNGVKNFYLTSKDTSDLAGNLKTINSQISGIIERFKT